MGWSEREEIVGTGEVLVWGMRSLWGDVGGDWNTWPFGWVKRVWRVSWYGVWLGWGCGDGWTPFDIESDDIVLGVNCC